MKKVVRKCPLCHHKHEKPFMPQSCQFWKDFERDKALEAKMDAEIIAKEEI